MLISQGPPDSNRFASYFNSASDDGRIVFFGSYENLVPEDTDRCAGIPVDQNQCADIYARDMEGNTTELVSTGPNGNHDYFRASGYANSSDGRYLFFDTAEPLVAEDVEEPSEWCREDGLGPIYCVDVYRRDLLTDTTTLVSSGPKKTGPGGANTRDWVNFSYSSSDGSRVFFDTTEQLVDADTDGRKDIYEWDHGTTRLVSIGPSGGNGDHRADFWGASTDGRYAFFLTIESLLPSDTDNAVDMYRRAGDTLELVTIGPTGGNADIHASSVGGQQGFPLRDGSGSFFGTSESLVPEDKDSAIDPYLWVNGETSLVGKELETPSALLLDGQTPDGGNFFVATTDPLVSQDTDTDYDLYALTLNQAPSCDGAAADKTILGPANNKLRRVRIAGATDPDGDAVTLEVTGVTQDEPVGRAPDARAGARPDAVRLRAERNRHGDGRVYRIAFRASDGTDSCSGVTKVEVRRHKKREAVDSAPPGFDSFGG
jgi:hypothetical protein